MKLPHRLPAPARLLLAVLLIALGGTLLTRPTLSLGLLALLLGAGLVVHGVTDLLDEEDRDPARVGVACAWIAAGVVVLVLPGLTVRLAALVVGIALVLNGVQAVWSAVRRRHSLDARIAELAFGVAWIVFGVLALTWPDITLLVVSVVFGARLVVAGLRLALATVRGAREPRADRAPGRLRRWGRTVFAVVTLLVAVSLAGVSAKLTGGSPVVDDFYAAPRDVPSEPGTLIRSEPFTRGVPDGARGWRILYTTTRGDGSAALSSGLVVVPEQGDGDWPVVEWTHGTTGYGQQCAPSLLAKPFEAGAMFVLPQVVEHGWAMVATDYIGLGTEGPHPYLIGLDSAHAALDAVRAARELAAADLGERTVAWGHSQGGGAALWTGAEAADYAPDVELSGVAALAPASNIPALFANLPNVTGGSVFASFAFAAYAATYDDVRWRDYIRPGAEQIVRSISERCLAEPGVLVSVLGVLSLSRDPEIFSRSTAEGALDHRAKENVPPATISAPLLLGQGADDSLVIPSAQDAYVDSLCADGQQVDYRTYRGRDHVPLVEPDSRAVTDLLSWTEQRFAGEPVKPGCTRSVR